MKPVLFNYFIMPTNVLLANDYISVEQNAPFNLGKTEQAFEIYF